jgi:hypothetical protein
VNAPDALAPNTAPVSASTPILLAAASTATPSLRFASSSDARRICRARTLIGPTALHEERFEVMGEEEVVVEAYASRSVCVHACMSA